MDHHGVVTRDACDPRRHLQCQLVPGAPRRHARAAPPQRRPHGRHAEDPPAGAFAPPSSPPVAGRSHRTDRRRSSGASRDPTSIRSTCCSPTGRGGHRLAASSCTGPAISGTSTPVRRHGIPVTNVLRTLCDLGAVDARSVNAAVGHVVTTGIGVTGGAASGVGTPRPTGPRRRRRPARRARRLGHRRQAGGQRARAGDASAPASSPSAAGGVPRRDLRLRGRLLARSARPSCSSATVGRGTAANDPSSSGTRCGTPSSPPPGRPPCATPAAGSRATRAQAGGSSPSVRSAARRPGSGRPCRPTPRSGVFAPRRGDRVQLRAL